MPIYEYICKDCGITFEKIQSINNADQINNCPECQSSNTAKKLSKCFTHGSSGKPGSSSSGCASCSSRNCSSCSQ